MVNLIDHDKKLVNLQASARFLMNLLFSWKLS